MNLKDPQMTDWKWEVSERAEQKLLFDEHKKDANFSHKHQQRYELRQRKVSNLFFVKILSSSHFLFVCK